MSKTNDLLTAGVVTQDPDDATKVIFTLELRLPKTAVDIGGFEAFAGQYGWSPSHFVNGVEVANPVPAHEFAKNIVFNFIRDVFRSAMMRQAENQARQAAQAQVDNLLAGVG